MNPRFNRPLTLEEQRSLLLKLPEIPEDHAIGRMLIEAILYSGIHPVTLADPKKHRLSILDDGQLSLVRPKNRKPVFIPLCPEAQALFPVLLKELSAHPRSAVRINQLIHAAAKLIGFNWINPRILRHTFGYRAWLAFHDAHLVSVWMGCDIQTVFNYYVNPETSDAKRRILSIGWESPSTESQSPSSDHPA